MSVKSNMENFLYVNPFSICPDLAKDIIDLYETEEKGKYEGVTAGGLDKNVKDTTDLVIGRQLPRWTKVYNFLETELNKNVKEYLKQLNTKDYTNELSEREFRLVDAKVITTDSMMIQRYIKQKGKYVYHNDASIKWETKSYRLFTFLWYLNTVEEGGETEFWGNYRIKPEIGKLLLFPACWTFPHTGRVPISDNKYIITGWLYVSGV
jgi:hypothetical protein